MKVIVLVVGLVVVLLPLAPARAQDALATPFTNCSNEESIKFRQVLRYLNEIELLLEDDFEINARRSGQERRSERQIDRRLDKLKIKCKARNTCNGSSAVHMVTGGNAVRICYSDASHFCRLVELVAHEFGHIAHIPRSHWGRHNREGEDNPDRVYQFGFFAGDLCEQTFQRQNFDQPRASDPTRLDAAPLSPPDRKVLAWPRSGIDLYPRRTCQGTGRRFLRGRDTDVNVRGFTFWDDLRYIGRQNAFTSARVWSGFWELCDKPDGGGPCVYLQREPDDDGDPNCFDLDGFNDQATSIAYLGRTEPSLGAFVYRDRDFLGRGKYVPAGSSVELADHGLAGKVSSLRIRHGLWEACERECFRGWCHTFSRDRADLADHGFDDRMRSFRQLTGTRTNGLLLYKDPGLRGPARYLPAGTAYTDFGGDALRINDAASSLVVLGGAWQVCTNTRFRGRCETVRGAIRDLSSIRMHNRISSARKVSER